MQRRHRWAARCLRQRRCLRTTVHLGAGRSLVPDSAGIRLALTKCYWEARTLDIQMLIAMSLVTAQCAALMKNRSISAHRLPDHCMGGPHLPQALQHSRLAELDRWREVAAAAPCRPAASAETWSRCPAAPPPQHRARCRPRHVLPAAERDLQHAQPLAPPPAAAPPAVKSHRQIRRHRGVNRSKLPAVDIQSARKENEPANSLRRFQGSVHLLHHADVAVRGHRLIHRRRPDRAARAAGARWLPQHALRRLLSQRPRGRIQRPRRSCLCRLHRTLRKGHSDAACRTQQEGPQSCAAQI